MSEREPVDLFEIAWDRPAPPDREALSECEAFDDALDAFELALAARDARIRADIAAEVLAELETNLHALPTTRTKAWDRGWDSISLSDALRTARKALSTAKADE